MIFETFPSPSFSLPASPPFWLLSFLVSDAGFALFIPNNIYILFNWFMSNSPILSIKKKGYIMFAHFPFHWGPYLVLNRWSPTSHTLFYNYALKIEDGIFSWISVALQLQLVYILWVVDDKNPIIVSLLLLTYNSVCIDQRCKEGILFHWLCL